MIRFTIDPDAKAGTVSDENRKTDRKADKPTEVTPAQKADPIAEENKKAAPKSRKAPAKRATSLNDDERLL